MLKIASESFIPALLLFLGLFLKIELSAPVPHQSLKTWLLSRGYFGSSGRALVAVAIVERFKQESM